MNLLKVFTNHVAAQQLFQPNDRLVLAVSGGVDSVVLADLCRSAGFDFIMVHCNFKLRGEESERDELFVRTLAEEFACDLRVTHFETQVWADRHKLSIQEAARALRYHWFDQIVQEEKANLFAQEVNRNVYLLTAHHADDHIETLLMHFFRGTGLRGLKGIPAVHGNIRRPLLSFSRAMIADYAEKMGLKFVEDSSNAEEKYTRNYLRHTIIPSIEKVYPQLRENLLQNIRRFQSIEALYEMGLQQIINKLCKQKEAELHIPIKQLLQYNNNALVFEIIRRFGFTEKQVEEVYKLTEAASGSFLQSPGMPYRIIRHRHWLIIAPSIDGGAAHYVVEAGQKEVRFSAGVLQVKPMDAIKVQLSDAREVAMLDAKLLHYPLILRKWKQGDYFYPLGMRKKKKLARFLIDLKLSRTEKEKVWVLESAQKIVWVLGYRIDDRFKITEHTQKVLQLTWQAE